MVDHISINSHKGQFIKKEHIQSFTKNAYREFSKEAIFVRKQ